MPRLVPGLGRGAGELSVLKQPYRLRGEIRHRCTSVFRIPGRCSQERNQDSKASFFGYVAQNLSPDGKQNQPTVLTEPVYSIFGSPMPTAQIPLQITDSRISSGAPSWSPDGTSGWHSIRLISEKETSFTLDLEKGPIQRITRRTGRQHGPHLVS